ncbi:olfactomedin-like protein 3 [Sarcophilus harrisii]|uniref:Olfactomedin like 3 n=1 Tax=Sarcophilus harrisii TaxID=9305 RepID=A0A7N4V5N3_SARHA|nr:olfactomedin-like protein 3 [Sarcophilus harrisii]
MGPQTPLLVLLLLSLPKSLQGQQQHLVEYMERRLAALEERLAQCQDQSSRHAAELRDFKNKMLPLLEAAEKERETLRSEADTIAGRVDRLEREVDYLETQNPAPPCIEVDEKATGGPGPKTKGRRNEKYDILTECSHTISQVRSMKILKRFGSSAGMWTKDPLGHSEKIFVLDGTQNDTAYVFPRLRDFTLSTAARKASRVRLPFPWVGTGQLVYGGFLYYARRPPGGPGGGEDRGDMLQLIKFHLANRTVVDSSVFPAEGLIPPYGLSKDTYIDLAADEEGLWAVYATQEDDQHLCLAKLDPQTLDTEQQWDTPCPRENAEAAFVICGALYVVYNTRPASRARVQCSFDASGALTPEQAAHPYFPRRYGAHASLRYNPRERQLYAWDDGYQIVYKLEMRKKEEEV